MASSLIENALQVHFDYSLGIPDNEGMVTMFRARVSTGLTVFLGCPSVLYEQEFEQFFDTAFVKDNDIICAVQGKFVGVSEEVFAGVFELPTTGLTDVADVPKDLVYDARAYFQNMVNRFRPPSVTVKARSFDAVTHERFILMTAIHFGLKINCSKILFDIMKGMVTKTSKQAKGFAAQIFALQKSAPNLTMGEAKTFPPLKIITAKTVGTYVSKKNGIDDGNEGDEPVMATTAVVKKKPVTKKKTVAPTTSEPIAKNKRTTVGRAAPAEKDLAMITVAQP
ncbi:hypothetical protein F511_15885 [Dorcoceras hygrometricum]|uniref:Uncharacterized protein n=1 Tax=Dorcoceras hygrometricum TaxID=472368 RepID=A0A2Z7CEA8_9LAMI|nr:hypothetical protein F511_15885 [Dorcoceras hygrometricum]